ncbi:MAG: DUF3108 domain-containing protein [candidate division WOR-3 bacterium]
MNLFVAILVGEILRYNLYWGSIRIGQARLQLDTVSDTILRSSLVIKTEGVFDKIYPVNDSMVSYFHSKSYRTIRFERYIDEAGYRSTTVAFYRGDTVFYHDGSKVYIAFEVMDPLSVLYFLRSKPSLDTLYILNFHVSKATQKVPVKIDFVNERNEKFFRVYIDLRDPKKTKVPAESIYFLKADSSKTPVRMEFKSKYGTIVGKLKLD